MAALVGVEETGHSQMDQGTFQRHPTCELLRYGKDIHKCRLFLEISSLPRKYPLLRQGEAVIVAQCTSTRWTLCLSLRFPNLCLRDGLNIT